MASAQASPDGFLANREVAASSCGSAQRGLRWHFSNNTNAASHPAGVAGQLARRIAEQLKLRQDIFLAELSLEPLLAGIEAAHAARKFAPIPRFPGGRTRFFAGAVDDGVTFAQVADAIRALAIPELRSIEAADLFRGGKMPAGKFSLMIRVTFQSGETTFTDAQIAEFSARIVAALETKLGASLRASSPCRGEAPFACGLFVGPEGPTS